jgi:putative transposase
MDRAARLQLHPTPEQAIALQETLRQFTEAFNAICAYGWQQHEKNGVRLHHATYRQTKAACPGLVSDLLIQARVKATEALKSAFTWKARHEANYQKQAAKAAKRGKPAPQFKPVRCPRSKSCPIRYNLHTYALNWERSTVRLSTSSGKQSIPFTVPAYVQKYSGGTVCTADLCFRKGRWWLHVVVHVPEPLTRKSDEVIGVDLGMNRPAVTSKKQFLGHRHWKEIDRRYFRLRRKLQSNGSKNAKRHLKKLSKRQQRFHRDCDHVLSKRIIQHALPGSTVVLENLTNIRDNAKMGRGKKNKTASNKRRLHSWTFAQLYNFIAYKGQERGIVVVKIDPRHTSQRCSKCSYQHRANRRSQSLFLCRKCGYCLNADLNAAQNIREKHLASLADFGTSLVGGLSSSSLSRPPATGEMQAPQALAWDA